MLSLLFSRRSLENPAVPLSDPAEWVFEAFGGGRSNTGIQINGTTALRYGPVWRATNLIATDVAKLGTHILRRVGTGKERDKSHPAYRLVRYKANSRMTSFQFYRCLTARALLRGNGYAWIVRDRLGKPTDLVPLPTETRPHLEGDRLYYLTKIGNEYKSLYADDVLHIRGLGDDIEGHSVVSLAAESFGLGLAAEKYGAKFFANAGRVAVALEHPGKLSKEAKENIRQSYIEQHAGLDKSFLPMVLQEGMKVHPFTIANDEAQFLETRQYQVRDVALWFGVPPHKLGDTTRTSYASLEQENQAYVDEALDGWLCTWEAELREKLLSNREKDADSHIVEFNRYALERADLNSRGEYYVKAVTTGWMSRDEVRSRESLNPMPDGEGEKFFSPLNLALAGEESSSDDSEDLRDRRIKSARAILADTVGRMARRLAHAIRGGTSSAAVLNRDHGAILASALAPVLANLAAARGEKLDDVDVAARVLSLNLIREAEEFMGRCQTVDIGLEHLEAHLVSKALE